MISIFLIIRSLISRFEFQEIIVSLCLLAVCLASDKSAEAEIHGTTRHSAFNNGHQGPYGYQGSHFGQQGGHYGHLDQYGHQSGHYGQHGGHYGHHGLQSGHYAHPYPTGHFGY